MDDGDWPTWFRVPADEVRAAALAELASRPLPRAELVDRLAAAGVLSVENADDAFVAAEELSDLLMERDDHWRTFDDVYASTSTLLDGAVFTHRVRADELARDVIDLTPDFVALAFGRPPVFVDDRVEAQVEYGLEGDDRIDAHGSLFGPEGWLRTYEAGDLLSFVGTSTGFELMTVAELAPADVEIDALADAYTSRARPDEGIEPLEALFEALTVQPTLFRRPVAPVVELLELAGLERRGGWIGPKDTEWVPPGVAARRRRREQIGEQFDFAECCDDAFVVVETAWNDFVAESLDPAAWPAVGAALEHEAVATAFARWHQDHGPSPLLDRFATRLADDAPDHRGVALYLRALVHDRAGDALAAEADLEGSVAARPDDPYALCELARTRMDRGDAFGALGLFGRAGLGTAHPDTSFLQELVQPRGVGRNDPCPCGSGRKFKQCCARDPKLPLERRAAWLSRKLAGFARDDPNDEIAIGLAIIATDPDRPDFGDELVRRRMADGFLLDLAIVEGGLAELFLGTRGVLLPADEAEMLEAWCDESRRLWEVTATRAGDGLIVRDTATGDVRDVVERQGSRTLEPGAFLLARVVPVGAELQFVGLPLRIDLRHRDHLIELLDFDPTADELAEWYGSLDAPPTLQTREGEALEIGTATLRADPAMLRAALDDHYERADGRWIDFVEIDGDRVVRATLYLEDGEVTVEAMSRARLDRVIATLEHAVPDIELVERKTGAGDEDEPADVPDVPGADEILAKVMREHEARWLDESVPALAGLTPRQAADDPTRREDLVALLAEFDRLAAAALPGAATFDADRLRAELGLRD